MKFLKKHTTDTGRTYALASHRGKYHVVWQDACSWKYSDGGKGLTLERAAALFAAKAVQS